jgi:hypothetical protein
MRNITGALCAIVLALGTLLLAQPSGTDAAATVLADARKALGGEQKIAGVKTVLATGRTRQVRGDNLVPIEFEIAMELPDRYVRKDEIPAQESGPTLTGFSGTELIQFPLPGAPQRGGGPAREGGGPPAPPTPEQQEAARRMRLAGVKQDFVRLTLGMFASSFASAPLTFSYVAKAEAPDGKADVLTVTGPDNFSARLFVNAETHLPIMMTWTQTGPGGRGPGGRGPAAAGREGGGPPPAAAPPPESRLFYADYRDVSGLKLPFRLRRALGPDTTEETTFDSFKINSKIDPKKFEVKK